jgi:hypothetical protein
MSTAGIARFRHRTQNEFRQMSTNGDPCRRAQRTPLSTADDAAPQPASAAVMPSL